MIHTYDAEYATKMLKLSENVDRYIREKKSNLLKATFSDIFDLKALTLVRTQ